MDDLLFSYADPSTPPVKRQVIRLIERATGQPQLKRIYFDNRRNPQAGENFWQAAIRHLALDVRYDGNALAAMPRNGPVVVVANHPYGVLDGLVIGWLVEKVRPDFLILTNAVLMRAPEIQNFVLPIDFADTDEARRANLRSRARAREHLADGGCVIVFPAGGVSTAPDKLGRKPAVDAPWGLFTPQLIQRSKATVVPICFSGQNSRLFQIASHLSLTLRLSLIFREVRNRIGTALSVAIGDPIPFAEIEEIRDRQQLANLLRWRTYALGKQTRPSSIKELPESALSAFWRVWQNNDQSGSRRRPALSRPQIRRRPR
jgi:putative hemolysin